MARYVIPKAGATVSLPNGVFTAEAGVSIVSSTNATPIVVTIPTGHGITAGDLVYISGHATNTSANGLRKVSAAGATTITLQDVYGNSVAGVGVGAATGTVRTDLIKLTDEEFEHITEATLDGDPLIDLGIGGEVAQVNPSATQANTALIPAKTGKSVAIKSLFISSDTAMIISLVNSSTHTLVFRQYVGVTGGVYLTGLNELCVSLIGEGFDYSTSENGNVFLKAGYEYR